MQSGENRDGRKMQRHPEQSKELSVQKTLPLRAICFFCFSAFFYTILITRSLSQSFIKKEGKATRPFVC